MTDWVTDPDALHAIIHMRLMLPGDEVRVQKCWKFLIDEHWEGKVAVLTAYSSPTVGSILFDTRRYSSFSEDAGASACPVAHAKLKGDEYYLAEWNIAAWRRPVEPAAD